MKEGKKPAEQGQGKGSQPPKLPRPKKPKEPPEPPKPPTPPTKVP